MCTAATQSALADEEDMRRMRAEELAQVKEARLMEAYQQLKYSDKATNMREQVGGGCMQGSA